MFEIVAIFFQTLLDFINIMLFLDRNDDIYNEVDINEN